MFLSGIGTAVPPQRYTQSDCLSVYENTGRLPPLTADSDSLVRQILGGQNGIIARHLALESLDEAFALDPDSLHARFLKNAPTLASRAAERGLEAAQLDAKEIDSVIISTCTGYLCPGLSSYVIENLGLRSDIQAFDLVGQGCGAALPNLRMAESLLHSGSSDHVLSISVEVCSAAFYFDNDPGVLISACLFGDGAAATVWSRNQPSEGRRVEWIEAESLIDPSHRDTLRFEQRNGMLRNILTRQVPIEAAFSAEEVLTKVLKRNALAQTDIACWILHAGGREVLRALGKRIGLAETDLRHSAAILRDHGNLSSPFVLFTLDRALADSSPGGWWWMSSFGAGFSCHGALLKVD
ncbi:MAG: stilbene synthase [Candidatus Omnitrophica bacterium]|nr:stilbene synthase [Candidatus Omnitrophota bacterium]